MAVNSVRNAPSIARIASLVELIEAEQAKDKPRWKDTVKRGLKQDGVSPRNFADAQCAFMVRAALANPEEPARLETDLYAIAREIVDAESKASS